MNELTFVRTMSVNVFKTEMNCSQIDIVKNPNTGKLFFITDTGIKGAVSDNYAENPCVSVVSGLEGEFFLIHKKSSDNVVATL